MHADFNDIIKQDGSKYNEKDFWDWVDSQLRTSREKYDNINDPLERTKKVDAQVSCSFTIHLEILIFS